jgi:hypothetical protein
MTGTNIMVEPSKVVTLTPVHPMSHRGVIHWKKRTQGRSLGQNNSHSGNYGDRGVEKPSKGDIWKTHTALVALKIKIYVTQKGERKIPVPKLEYMEVDIEEEDLDWAT